MPATTPLWKYFWHFFPVGPICRVTVPYFPKHKFSHLHILWTSQVWHHNSSCFLFLSLSYPTESSSTTVHVPSPSISSLLLLFLQSFLYLHFYHLWLGLGPLDLLGKASILVFLPPRISLLPSRLHPAAVGWSFWSTAFHQGCTLLKNLKWLPTVSC